jgi:NAD(P)-dependent dehydrogenase (short-subunit alcohol dehydrogenase family)
MRIIVVGASGRIGSAIVAALAPRHDIIGVSRRTGTDLTDIASVDALFKRTGKVDAVIAVPGHPVYKPLLELTDADFAATIAVKVMAQVNLARRAIPNLNDGGSITLTSGTFGREPEENSAAIALSNGALEGFAVGASKDLTRGLRINVVTPPNVNPLAIVHARVKSMPAEDVALAYVHAVESWATGEIIDARHYARR